MREIKFRAWDKENNRIFTHFLLGSVSGHVYDNGHDDETYIELPDQTLYEVMQFTGLKDKNGVEIYEGDIVQVYHLPSNNPEQPEWDNIPCFKFTADMANGDCYKWTMTEATREIIGNIYQNPKLLK